VFTTIDARDLPEHLARGDFRASSIADCSARRAVGAASPVATVATVATVAATSPPTATPTPAKPVVPQQQQGVVSGAPLPDVSVSRLVGAATTTPAAGPTVATPAAATAGTPALNVAGAQATPEPEVSTLPKSGGEPDRGLLVVGLLGLIGAGLGLLGLSRFQLGRGR
jgi:hypothetical protein